VSTVFSRKRVEVTLAAALSLVAASTGTRAQESNAGTPATSAVTSAQAGTPEAIVPFTLHVPDRVLADLKQRLSRTRYPDAIPGTGWEYGTDTAYLKELVEYWRTRYDWRAQERRLNRFNHFKTNIDGLDIHFIHQRAAAPTATTVLLLNGWPSSFVEYAKVIGPLTDPAAHDGRAEEAVNVVVPSLPGYGFSDKPRERGYDPARMAVTMVKLMARLGYSKYIAHGSDWGLGIATHMADQDSRHMAGLHLVTCSPLTPTSATAPPPLHDRRAYAEIQSTKPQTLGANLSDSPAGLASWIVEKWHGWSDHDGNVEKVHTKDELLTNVMIYWITNTGTSAARLYYEARHQNGRLNPSVIGGLLPHTKISVPTGCSSYDTQGAGRAEPANIDERRAAASTRYPVVYFAVLPRGGHFPAAEQPALWDDDFRAFLRTLSKAAATLPSER
jgi:microsomal epoxide hydrolase